MTQAEAARRGLLAGLLVVVALLLAEAAVVALRQQRVAAPLGLTGAAAVMAVPPLSPSLAPATASVPVSSTPPVMPPGAPVEPPPSTPAPPSRPSLDGSPGWEQRRGAAALRRITYPWQQLGYSIAFAGSRPGLLGGTIPERHQIIVFIRSDEDVNLVAHTIAHEIGHAVDRTYNDDRRRRSWLEARGLPVTTSWFTCNMCSDFATGSGDFAESFAAGQTGPAYFRGQLAPPPTDAQVSALGRFFQA